MSEKEWSTGAGNEVTVSLPVHADLKGPDLYSNLPLYIKQPPDHLRKDDICHLANVGAFTIPHLALRYELLKAYVKYVHPFMPVLDLETILLALACETGPRKVSLLLFQAVMFAGATYVEMKYFHADNYTSRKAARAAFFDRAMLLHNHNYEADSITLIQSLLILSDCGERFGNPKDSWHCMSRALLICNQLGLYNFPYRSSITEKNQRLWKRIWWCAFTRDRIIALDTRQPMQIDDGQFDVPMLTVTDFDYKIFPSEIIDKFRGCALLQNSKCQLDAANIFIEHTKLSIYIGHALTARYSFPDDRFLTTEECIRSLVPKRASHGSREVQRCESMLKNWKHNLPAEIELQDPTHESTELFIHYATLHMIYFAISNLLHQPQVDPFTLTPTRSSNASNDKIERAAVEITRIMTKLHRLNLIQYLPPVSVMIMVPTATYHMFNMKSENLGVRIFSLQRLSQCITILQQLRENYASAEFAILFVQSAHRQFIGGQLNFL